METARITRALALAGALVAAPGAMAAAGTAKAAAPGAVTFNKDIAPMMFARCTTCHRPGEVAPFPLMDYRDASKRAKLLRAVIEDRSMPPWKALPGPVHFADERRLSDAEVATFGRWVDQGTPEGDPADLPPAPKFAAGWRLGEPDRVLSMDEPYPLVAEGADVYRCFVIPLQVPAGKYLKAVEYRPGNRRVVHHAVLSMLPHKVAQAKLAEGDGKSFGSGLAPPGQLLPGQLAFWTPGMEPRPLPKGFGVAWPKGVDLVLQLHLHPSGKPETERSTIGLHFTDEPPTDRLQLVVMNNDKLSIGPGEADHAEKASVTLPVGFKLYGIFPHMHLIGRTVKLTATLPDGTTRPLIAIDDWDFQWQAYYECASPERFPAGTRLDARFTYDNSAANPANPSRPPKRVSYGEQTVNEMAIVVLDVTTEEPLRKGPGARRPAMGGKPSGKSPK